MVRWAPLAPQVRRALPERMAEWAPLVRPVQQALLGRQVLPGPQEQLAQLELQGRQAPLVLLVLQVPLAPRELRESPVPRE